MDKTEKSIDKIDEQIDSLLNNKKKRVKSSEKIIVNYDNVSTDTKKIEEDDSINPILIAVIIGLVVIMIILYAILLTR